MLKQNFEDPLDTAQDIVDNKITLYMYPGGQLWKQFLEQSSVTAYNKLAESIIITKDYNEFNSYTYYKLLGMGTHAQMASRLARYEIEWGKTWKGGWYRSKEIVKGQNPYGGYLSNKKWYLNEVSSHKQQLRNDHNQMTLFLRC